MFNKDITIKKRSLSFTKFSNNDDKFNFINNQNFNNDKKIGNYILGKKLGQGTFGIVVLAKHELTGENVAIKILDKDKIIRENNKTRLEREIRIMKKMYHNNIVHLYQVIENLKQLFIVMEYISGKELFDYIIHKKHLDELESCKFYQQIISGIEYLGKTKVAHRDLKPENLLLDTKKNIKIVDFGLSNTYCQDELLVTACGSPCYAAPEMLSGEKYDGVNIDIWSSGIVLYAMLCGYLPFEDNNNPKLYKKIIKGEFETPEFLSPSAVDILHRILNVNPEKRYTIEQIKKHPWFNQINPKINMSEGLLIDYYIVPFDEEIISQMVNEYSFNEQEIKVNLLINKHNNITTTYYLILKKKIRCGQKTIGNMTSQMFIDYINDEKNLASTYDFDISRIIIDRVLKRISIPNYKNENKIEIKKNENINEPQFKYYENNISKFNKQSKLNHNNNIIDKDYNTLNKDKAFETLESENNNSNKKFKVKDKKNNIKTKNIINYFDTNKQIYKKKEHIKYNYHKKKFKSTRDENISNNLNNKNEIQNKANKKNILSQKYFCSTFTENNLKNISQTNEEISLDDNNNNKIINRISLLKQSIIKSMTNKNRPIRESKNTVDNNSKDINMSSNFSPQHYFSNKNFFTKIKPDLSSNKKNINNEKVFTKIDNSGLIKNKRMTSSKERYRKISMPTAPIMDKNNKPNDQQEIIRIIQRIKNKAKDMDSNTIVDNISNNNGFVYPSRSNFTKTNFYVNSASRVSRTPNNNGRNITNRIIFEHNLNNKELNQKVYEINLGVNKNNAKNIKNDNLVNNNNNNINIHINLTNIYKNFQGKDIKDDQLYTFNKNKTKIESKEKRNKNEIIRQNKFIDSNLKNRKFFINTSVSLEKKNEERGRRRYIESENKENKFLINRINNKQEIINNFKSVVDRTNEIKSINIKKDNEESSIQKKERNDRYLKLKSKNKKFGEFRINKMNSLNNNKTKIEKIENNDINNINSEKKNFIRIKKKNTISNKNLDNIDKNINQKSINFPSFYDASYNHSNIRLNNTNTKSFPKKHIYNSKQIFKSLNTDFYNKNEKLTTTEFNFFSTKNNNMTNLDYYRDKILKKDKNNILSERIDKNKMISITKKLNDVKKNNNFMKPFDLNSIIYIKKESNLKEIISKFLKAKNIHFYDTNNKYSCSKKELKFEFNIININELDRAFIIKAFQKPNKYIKLKNLYNSIIIKLINNIK